MRINRHNYETFFLLYVDKELSAADRRAVDMFVQENPDLKVELQMLQQTVCEVDNTLLDKKDWLYKAEDISALQENLLLYADEELNAADKQSIESLLATDYKAKVEWHILQQTKLQPDTAVIFADKQSLYRTTGSRVVTITWWRIAAAALLLGFGIWGGIAMYTNTLTVIDNDGGLVENLKVEKVSSDKNNDVQKIVVPDTAQEENATADHVATTIQPSSKTNTSKQAVASNNTENKEGTAGQHLPNDRVVIASNPQRLMTGTYPKSNLEIINNSASNKIIASNVIPPNNNSSRVSGNNAAVVKSNPNESVAVINTPVKQNNSMASESINTMLIANNKSADEGNVRYLNLDDDKDKRTGLGGFLRKAKRIIERTTNINTGEGIMVAGFEIALK